MGNGMNKILPGLYIGNCRDAQDIEQLKTNGITHVLSIHDNAAPVLNKLKYKCVNISDSPSQDISKHIWKSIEFIHRARLNEGCVLVHCIAGISRSTTIAAAYVMTVTSLGWRDSINFIRCSRCIANPNVGFQRQLQEFEVKRLEETKHKLKKKYGIDPSDDIFAKTLLSEQIDKLPRDFEEQCQLDGKRVASLFT